MIDYNKLGTCISNVYNPTQNSSRKVVTRLEGNLLTLNFMSIVEVPRENDIFLEKRKLDSEANQLIEVQIKKIKSQYEELSENKFNYKEITEVLDPSTYEILTANYLSPKRTIKFSYKKCFEIS